MHYFVLFPLNFSIMSTMSLSLDFRYFALSRPSISIISLLMQHVSHEYILYVTFITSQVVFQHPILGASKNMQIPTVSEFDEIRRVS